MKEWVKTNEVYLNGLVVPFLTCRSLGHTHKHTYPALHTHNILSSLKGPGVLRNVSARTLVMEKS